MSGRAARNSKATEPTWAQPFFEHSRYSHCRGCHGLGCVNCRAEAEFNHPEWFDLPPRCDRYATRFDHFDEIADRELINDILGIESRGDAR